MEFKELPMFSELVGEFLTDKQFLDLQISLVASPEMGDLIPGTGGARKVRVGAKGKGKRGGARVIYYFQLEYTIHLLAIYSKNEKADLDYGQKKLIASYIQAVKKGSL
jgi:hypothetical protein